MACYVEYRILSSLPALSGAPDLVDDVPDHNRSVEDPYVGMRLPPNAVDVVPGP